MTPKTPIIQDVISSSANLGGDGESAATSGSEPSAADDALLIERAAEKVYAAMVWAALTASDPDPNWVEGGNSHAQYEARRAARYILGLAAREPSAAWRGIEGNQGLRSSVARVGMAPSGASAETEGH